MLGEESQFSSIIMASSPEFLIFVRGNSLDDYIKEISNALPPNSGKLLLCVTSSINMFEQGIKMKQQQQNPVIAGGKTESI